MLQIQRTSLDSSSSSITATVSSYNSTLQILKFTGATGTFEADREITFSNGATLQLQKLTNQQQHQL